MMSPLPLSSADSAASSAALGSDSTARTCATRRRGCAGWARAAQGWPQGARLGATRRGAQAGQRSRACACIARCRAPTNDTIYGRGGQELTVEPRPAARPPRYAVGRWAALAHLPIIRRCSILAAGLWRCDSTALYSRRSANAGEFCACAARGWSSKQPPPARSAASGGSASRGQALARRSSCAACCARTARGCSAWRRRGGDSRRGCVGSLAVAVALRRLRRTRHLLERARPLCCPCHAARARGRAARPRAA